MAKKLPRFNKGTTPTLLNAAVANEFRDRIQALCDVIVSPSGFAKMEVSESRAVLDLSPINDLITQLQQSLAAIQQTTSNGVTIQQVTSIVNNAINAKFQNVTATTVCNGGGTFTTTFRFS